VENGLKYHLLGIIRKSNTDELQQYYNNIGHNIKRMLKEAQCGGQFNLKGFSTEREQWAEAEQFHQVWRYGVKAKKSADEDNAEATLKKIAEWLDPIVN
jgi:flavodoxin